MSAWESRTEARVAMDTLVAIEVVGESVRDAAWAGTDEAFRWFAEAEQICSRFDPASELSRLCAAPGVPVRVSELLFSAIRFAVALAERTDGAFDPSVGRAMVAAGFDREYRTGARLAVAPRTEARWADIELDERARTVTLHRPLTLDLGAVAKGLAIDLAAESLSRRGDLVGFVIDAGGDIFAAGHGADGQPWRIGLAHPRLLGEVTDRVRLDGMAVCTSGDYERKAAGGHHILDPRTGSRAGSVASASVIAPSAMAADALATAVFVLGPEAGLALLDEEDLDGVMYAPSMERFATQGFKEYLS